MQKFWIAAALWFWSCGAAAQLCPVRHSSQPVKQDSGFYDGPFPSALRVLHGMIVHHTGWKDYFSLRPEIATCGETDIELSTLGLSEGLANVTQQQIETFRDCEATVQGRLDFPIESFPNRPMTLRVVTLAADPSCAIKPALPDRSVLRPSPKLQNYAVRFTIDMAGEGSIQVRPTYKGRALRPWQAYVDYWTYDAQLRAACGLGFVVSEVSGKPVEAKLIRYEAVVTLSAPPPNRAKPTVMNYLCTRVVPAER